MSEQITFPQDDSESDQIPMLEQLDQGIEPIVKYENEILNEIY